MAENPAFRYSIDTSSLVHAFRRNFPPDILPSLWDQKFDELIEQEIMFAPHDVLDELERKDDKLYAWAKARAKMFIELDKFESQLSMIMGRYPRLVDTKTGKSGADPMVIALALSMNQRLTVVTQEGVGSAKSPRIPYVCQQEDLRQIDLLQLFRDQQWSFGP